MRSNSTNKFTNSNLRSGSFKSLLSKTDNEQSITKCRKLSNPRVYNSINIMHQTADNSTPRREIG